jgi:hypothetical protein
MKMKFKKWTQIEDCPHGRNFIAILKRGWRIKIKKVYVHVDNHWLMWRELRTLDKIGIGNWKCIAYFK